MWLIRLVVFLAVVAAVVVGVYFFVLKGDEEGGVEVTPDAIEAGELFPASADFIAYLDIESILGDADVQSSYQQFAQQYNLANPSAPIPATIDQALLYLQQQAGGQVDPGDFDTVVMFADVDTFDQDLPYVGVIITGTFDKALLEDMIEDQQGVTSSDYKGFTLYKVPMDAQTQIAIAFLSDSAIVAGTEDAVKGAIDVQKGDADALASGGVYDAYNSLGCWFKIAVGLPSDAQAGMDAPFNAMDTVGFSVDKSGQTITLKAIAHFANATSAQNAQSMITGVIQQAQLYIQAQPDTVIPAQAKTMLTNLLTNVSVTTSDSTVTAQLSLTLTEIQQLVSLVQSLAPYIPIPTL